MVCFVLIQCYNVAVLSTCGIKVFLYLVYNITDDCTMILTHKECKYFYFFVGKTVVLYRVGDHIDLSRGPMVGDTSFVGKCTVTAVSM
jgi:hypothetical protein